VEGRVGPRRPAHSLDVEPDRIGKIADQIIAGKIRRLEPAHDHVFPPEYLRPAVEEKSVIGNGGSRAEIELCSAAFPDYVGVAAHQKVGLVADIDDDSGVTGKCIAERLHPG